MKKTYKHPTIKVKPIETKDLMAASNPENTLHSINSMSASDTNGSSNNSNNNFAKSNSIWYGDDEESSQN